MYILCAGWPEMHLPYTPLDLENADIRYAVGVALLVSNSYGSYGLKSLNETHKDSNKMKHFLLKCRYAVFSRQNLNKDDFIARCKELAQYNYQKASTNCRRLVVAFFGHGNNDDLIFQDNESVSVNKMVKIFRPANAENSALGEMVRMFFIDSCRGGKNDSSRCASRSATVAISDERSSGKEYPNDVNMLVVYSNTSQGTAREGFWTSHLLGQLECLNEDVVGALIKVNNEMMYRKNIGKYYQIGEHISTLAVRVHFTIEALVVTLNETLDGKLDDLVNRPNDLKKQTDQLEYRSNQLEVKLNRLKDRSHGVVVTLIYLEAKSIHSEATSNQTLAIENQALFESIYSEAKSAAKLNQEESVFSKAKLITKLHTLVTASDHLQDKLNRLEKKINQSEDIITHQLEQLWDRLPKWVRLKGKVHFNVLKHTQTHVCPNTHIPTCSGIARPGPTRACALPSTSQALPSPDQQDSCDSLMNTKKQT